MSACRLDHCRPLRLSEGQPTAGQHPNGHQLSTSAHCNMQSAALRGDCVATVGGWTDITPHIASPTLSQSPSTARYRAGHACCLQDDAGLLDRLGAMLDQPPSSALQEITKCTGRSLVAAVVISAWGGILLWCCSPVQSASGHLPLCTARCPYGCPEPAHQGLCNISYLLGDACMCGAAPWRPWGCLQHCKHAAGLRFWQAILPLASVQQVFVWRFQCLPACRLQDVQA